MGRLFYFILFLNVASLFGQELNKSELIEQKLNDFVTDIIDMIELNRWPVQDTVKQIETYTNNRIKGISRTYFVGEEQFMYDFQLFEKDISKQTSRSLPITEVLDNFVTDLISINTLKFSEVQKSNYWTSSEYVYECKFQINVTTITGEGNYFESGKLYVVVDNVLRFKGIFNQNEPNLSFTLKDKEPNEIPSQTNRTPLPVYEELPINDEKELELPQNTIKDRDGDGIPDNRDKCPNVPGSKNDGCPEIIVISEKDSDNDGILDHRDKCPYVYGKNKDGCPVKTIIGKDPYKTDRDGDGIPDNRDDCPDKYGPKSNKGCPKIKKLSLKESKQKYLIENPYQDTDRDGVVNNKDKCPFTSGFSDYNGCPYPVKYYISRPVRWSFTIGTGGIVHPETRNVTNISADGSYTYDNQTFITLFGIENEQFFPFNVKLSVDYLLQRVGNVKHGFRASIGYSAYIIRYNDSQNEPSVDPEFITNTIAFPTYIDFGLGYSIGVTPMFDLRGNITQNHLFNFSLGANYKYRTEEDSVGTSDFQSLDPIYAFFQTRVYIFFLNVEYPINDFISTRIVAENSNFTPWIFSFGLEIPF